MFASFKLETAVGACDRSTWLTSSPFVLGLAPPSHTPLWHVALSPERSGAAPALAPHPTGAIAVAWCASSICEVRLLDLDGATRWSTTLDAGDWGEAALAVNDAGDLYVGMPGGMVTRLAAP